MRATPAETHSRGSQSQSRNSLRRARPSPARPATAIDWGRFFGRYHPLAVQVGRGLVGREDLAEELAQEAARGLFERATRGALRFESTLHARNYFLRAVRNLAAGAARRAGRLALTSLDEAGEGALGAEDETPGDGTACDGHGEQGDALASAVTRAVQSLPDRERIALTLRYFRGLTYREMAAHTGTSISTLQARVEVALAGIRRRIVPGALSP